MKMKKVARLRIAQEDVPVFTGGEQSVRTTGRIKKPKAVFDPSDNYLPRAQRLSLATTASSAASVGNGATSVLERSSGQILDPYQSNKRLSQSSSTSFGLSPVESPVDVCALCQKREAKRGTHARNKLISCLHCEKKVHKLCMKVEFEDLDTLRQNFKCDDCLTCELCDPFDESGPKNDRELVTCAKCVKSYHLSCHIPNVHKFQQLRQWKCNKCVPTTLGNGSALPVKIIRKIIGDEPVKNYKPQQQQQQQQQQQHEERSLMNGNGSDNEGGSEQKKFKRNHDTSGDDDVPLDELKNHQNQRSLIGFSPNELSDVPDVKDWSVDQVTEYFAKYFPKEAHVFKEHEIDGTSLLLLKRSDVVKKLPLKLGPSLRIYSLILKIQTQLNDPTLGWNCGL